VVGVFSAPATCSNARRCALASGCPPVETNGPREKAVRLPALTIAYRTQGLATFPAASSKWALFNSLPVTTPRRRHQTGDDGEGDGEPVAQPV